MYWRDRYSDAKDAKIQFRVSGELKDKFAAAVAEHAQDGNRYWRAKVKSSEMIRQLMHEYIEDPTMLTRLAGLKAARDEQRKADRQKKRKAKS